MHYETLGTKGPHLVMLHGWGQNLESLKAMGQHLSQTSRVLLFDLPGFGKSLPPDGVWDSFQYAHALMQLLQSLDVKNFSVLGHSFGGKVAMSLAVAYPEQIDKLILLAPSGLKRKRTFAGWARFLAIKYAGRLVKYADKAFGTKWFETAFIPRFGSSDYKQAKEMRAVLVKSVNEDFTPHLAKIHAPTLLMWGEEDQETPKEMAERMQKEIRHCTLMCFPHKGHHPFQECGSHLCAYHIRSFLRGNNG